MNRIDRQRDTAGAEEFRRRMAASTGKQKTPWQRQADAREGGKKQSSPL